MNPSENNARKGAKAQKWRASPLCAFAPLREKNGGKGKPRYRSR